MSKSNRSIPPACKYAEAASAEPQLQCSCAVQERTWKKNCHDCLLESPYASLKGPPGSPVPQVSLLKSGSLGVKIQRVPTILRLGNRDFNMRSSPCVNGNVALCSSYFLPFTFHSGKQQTLILWRFGSKIDFLPCRTSCEKNRVAPILGSIKHGAFFIKTKRPITMFRYGCRHNLSRS